MIVVFFATGTWVGSETLTVGLGVGVLLKVGEGVSTGVGVGDGVGAFPAVACKDHALI